MEKIILALPGNEALAEKLSTHTEIKTGRIELRTFPDGETLVRLHSSVENKKVFLICSLVQADTRSLPLYFLGRLCKDLGAWEVVLVAPYLGYMRQDMAFQTGEAVTTSYFAEFISGFVDRLITVDPHLHRFKQLSDIYSVPSRVVRSAPAIASWIKIHIPKPLVLGPDSESRQWVSEVASDAGASYEVLQKIRQGDRQVEIGLPDLNAYRGHTPVLVDDIISTGTTLCTAAGLLEVLGFEKPVCIGVHAVFSEGAYASLKKSYAGQIATVNTIAHESNRIDIAPLIATHL